MMILFWSVYYFFEVLLFRKNIFVFVWFGERFGIDLFFVLNLEVEYWLIKEIVWILLWYVIILECYLDFLVMR